MRQNKLMIVVVFVLFATQTFAQKLEYSGFFDSYYYKGIRNLNFTANAGMAIGLTDMAVLKPGLAFGVGANYRLWPRTMFGVEFHYITLAGTDNQKNRNLAFKSNNLEFLAYGRLYFLDDVIRVAADRGRAPRFLKAYIMTGIGIVSYSPRAYFTNIETPPTDPMFLYNEGGGGITPVIPVGLGLSWRISNKVSLITEGSYRYTFTDMLDGISKRGNPKNKDGYILVDVKLQIAPWAPSKKKSRSLAPPEKYEGPKGTNTWKNRPKEQPAKRNNYYQEEEQPAEEEIQFDENGNPIPKENKEEQPAEGDPVEQEPTQELEELK
jgi:hypothetical protein